MANSQPLKYHHLGIPTKEVREDEVHLEHLGVHVSGFEDSVFGIEWMRFEESAPYPDLVKTVPHVAFEVPSVRKAIVGKKVIIEPNSPSPGVVVAFIEENGAPIEFIEIDRNISDVP
jgi:hypothetical protein